MRLAHGMCLTMWAEPGNNATCQVRLEKEQARHRAFVVVLCLGVSKRSSSSGSGRVVLRFRVSELSLSPMLIETLKPQSRGQ